MNNTRLGDGWKAWLRLTTPYDAVEPAAGRFRAQQLRACIQLAPWVVVSNLINLIAVLRFVVTDDRALLWAWAAGVAWTVGLGLRPWLFLRRGTLRESVSLRTLDRIARNAAALGLCWGALPAWLYPSAGSLGQKVLLGIVIGMVCAGGFVLSSMPRAAVYYVLTLTTGAAIGMSRANPAIEGWIVLLLGAYAAIVMATVFVVAGNLGRRLMAEAEAARQTELVGLLLNDFEQHSSDWLWEIDAAGRIDHVSQRLARAFGRSQEDLLGASLVDLIAGTLRRPTDDEQRALAQFRDALGTDEPFRRLDIPVIVAGQRQWWSMSGKPLLDAQGRPAGWRGVGSDVTRSRLDHAEMVRLANVDALTGLANRHQFQSHLSALGERPCTLYYLDLDNFKAANDFHGHAVGDRVLQLVASRFQAQIRYGDLLARLGGDEFALISWARPPRRPRPTWRGG